MSPRHQHYFLNDGTVYMIHYGDPASYVKGYHDQVAYLVKGVRKAIDGILANSPEPPIILLQSDHGSGLGLFPFSLERTDLPERMSILSAYYFPGGKRQGLHDEITPVNSFRVLFNNYFEANLPTLPDESYFSSWVEPQKFSRVTDKVKGQTYHGPPPPPSTNLPDGRNPFAGSF